MVSLSSDRETTHEIVFKKRSYGQEVMARFILSSVSDEAALKEVYEHLMKDRTAQLYDLEPIEELDTLTIPANQKVFHDGVLLMEHRTYPVPELPHYGP